MYLCGVVLIEALLGKVARHRLNRGGDRAAMAHRHDRPVCRTAHRRVHGAADEGRAAPRSILSWHQDPGLEQSLDDIDSRAMRRGRRKAQGFSTFSPERSYIALRTLMRRDAHGMSAVCLRRFQPKHLADRSRVEALR